MKFRIFVSCPW